MRKWIGTICIILGVACLLAAIGFVIYNRWEAENAADISQSLLQNVQLVIDEHKTNDLPQSENDDLDSVENDELPEDVNTPAEMATIKVDGYDCIGVLSVPVLELKLPVLTDWSYTKLKQAPCHYYGSYYEYRISRIQRFFQRRISRTKKGIATKLLTDTNRYLY